MNKKTLTLSIVIPAYNEERYLKFCLDSVAAQSVRPTEVIVVDNNSTDNTVKIARSYKFVKVVRESRQGVVFARNSGFEAAKGDIIGRIDADTILPEDWSAKVIEEFSRGDIGALTGPVGYYDMPFPRSNYRFNDSMCRIAISLKDRCPFLYGCNMAISQKSWRVIAGKVCLGNDAHEDIDLAIHLFTANQKLVYRRDLLAMVSGRRYNNKPSDFFGYVRMFPRAYAEHNWHNPTVYPALALWCLGYGLYHPWRKVWRGIYGHFNQAYPLTDQRRKNPMSMVIQAKE